MDHKQLFDLTGKSVAITGGGGVLCGALAECLASAGAQVAVLDLKLEAAQAVVDRINKSEPGSVDPVRSEHRWPAI